MPAFRATFSDMKLVKTRQVAQLIFEVPIEEFDAAYEVLGGMPVPSKERWFGIAAIAPAATARPEPNQPQARAKQDWRDLPPSQQAGIRINEPAFGAYLKENHADEWHETGDADGCLKMILRITSKTELKTDPRRMMLWKQLDDAYQAWKALEHA